MTSREKWGKVFSCRRLGNRISGETKSTKGRTAFHRDFDRIVFSSAFRRLQDKTQVVPFARSDYVRTRLTHSIEASCVGRSLGLEIGIRLRNCLPKHIEPSDVGQIVAAACLAHDIGNSRFGHSGEAAIQSYFAEQGQQHIKDLPPNQRKDFENFDGNAQGFRVLTQLQHPSNPGLQLTCATLAAFIKYPNPSVAATDKKFSYFQSEKHLFEDLASEVGLIYKAPGAYHRHPLAFLVEAADDICYTIMDFEDAFRLGHLTILEICDYLGEITRDPEVKSQRHPTKKKLLFFAQKASTKLFLKLLRVSWITKTQSFGDSFVTHLLQK
jgi:dGTPase